MLNQFTPNIPSYFAYAAIKGFGFRLFAALWVIYLQEQRGLNLSQSALIDVTFFNAASHSIRGTLLSMRSLMFIIVAAISQPTLGLIADRAGLPTTYVVLAGSLGILTLFLLWASRRHFPQAALST